MQFDITDLAIGAVRVHSKNADLISNIRGFLYEMLKIRSTGVALHASINQYRSGYKFHLLEITI